MKSIKKTIIPIVITTVWISVSEFVRNEFLFKFYWTDHYKSLGITFPSEPVNGAVWGLWSLLLAILIYIIERKFSLFQTTMICWLAGFLMMWTVVGNLGVLPLGLLTFAVPLSLLEVFLAALIVKKMVK
jgi:hypothetical protein